MGSNFLRHESCPNCGSRDNVGVWDDGGKYCFGCHWIAYPNFAAKLQNLEAFRFQKLQSPVDKNGQTKVELPRDFSTILPGKAKKWLLQYLTAEEISAYSFGWSEDEERLIIPLFDEETGDFVFWTGRYMGESEDESKYWSEGERSSLQTMFGDPQGQKFVVFVEDVISAIKVGRVAPTVPILGTSIPLERIRMLSKTFSEAVIWLDSNMKREAVKQALNLSNWFEAGGRCVFSEKDPKCYSTDEIKEFLEIK